uniref:Uncharacterized protein n=1 Tax=Romanomermis culicivorax TaxID=13658 RepID=A0A915JLV6_ROMCU
MALQASMEASDTWRSKSFLDNSKKIFYDNGSEYTPYYQDFCLIQTFMEYFWQKCHCILYATTIGRFYFNERNFGRGNIDFSKSCTIAKNGKCLVDFMIHDTTWSAKVDMPRCPQACEESVFSMQLSHKILTQREVTTLARNKSILINALAKQSDFPDWMRRNLVSVKFSLQMDRIDLFIDSQELTFFDLLTNIANILGLFFGMSFEKPTRLPDFPCKINLNPSLAIKTGYSHVSDSQVSGSQVSGSQ